MYVHAVCAKPFLKGLGTRLVLARLSAKKILN